MNHHYHHHHHSGSSRQQLLLRHWLANSISSSASNTCQLYCIPQRCIINKQQWSDSGWLIGLLSAVQHNSSYSISYGQEHQMYMYNAVREEQWQSLAQSRSLLHLHDRYQLVVPNLFGLGRRRRDHYLAALGICENECKGIGCRFCNSSYVRTHTHTHMHASTSVDRVARTTLSDRQATYWCRVRGKSIAAQRE
jgi:hypothetical protein